MSTRLGGVIAEWKWFNEIPGRKVGLIYKEGEGQMWCVDWVKKVMKGWSYKGMKGWSYEGMKGWRNEAMELRSYEGMKLRSYKTMKVEVQWTFVITILFIMICWLQQFDWLKSIFFFFFQRETFNDILVISIHTWRCMNSSVIIIIKNSINNSGQTHEKIGFLKWQKAEHRKMAKYSKRLLLKYLL